MFGDGKTVLRASYGIFFDHPLMALVFDSVVADGTQAPQILLFGGSLEPVHGTEHLQRAQRRQCLCRHGLSCLPAAFTYLPNQQRFNPTPNTQSVWINQNFLRAGTAAGSALRAAVRLSHGGKLQVRLLQPGQPRHRARVRQQFHRRSLQYNFNGGRRLNRPINANTAIGSILIAELVQRHDRPVGHAGPEGRVLQQSAGRRYRGRQSARGAKCGNPACGAYIPPALVSFFRPSGFNATLQFYAPPQVNGLAQQVLTTTTSVSATR